jgi:multidrug efflux pump
VQTPLDTLQVRVAGQFQSLEQLRGMPIRGSLWPAAPPVRHRVESPVATLDPPEVKVRHQGRQVIALGVSMAKGGDIIALGKALKTATQQIDRQLPAGPEAGAVAGPAAGGGEFGQRVRRRADRGDPDRAGRELRQPGTAPAGDRHRWYRRYYVDMRPGLIVGITIPLVLAMTFIGMHYWGIGLHKISLGSLIISLGLLVDDAIIAVEMMVRKIEEGYDKVRAATFAYEITAMPMLTGTLITAAGFLPIGIARSVTGEYTFAIFAVTVLALVMSWFVSVYFRALSGHLLLRHRPTCAQVPLVGAARNARGGRQPGPTDHHPGHERRRPWTKAPTPHESFDSPFYNRFRALVKWCMRHRWLTIGADDAIFGLGVAAWAGCSSNSSRIRAARRSCWTSGSRKAPRSVRTKSRDQRVEQRLMARARGCPASAPGSAPVCRASICRWTCCFRRPTCRS